MLHFVLHDSSNPSTNNPLYLNNLHRFFHPLYLYISFYRPYTACAHSEHLGQTGKDGAFMNNYALTEVKNLYIPDSRNRTPGNR